MSFNPPRSEGTEATPLTNPSAEPSSTSSTAAPTPTSTTTYSRRRMSINSSKSSHTINNNNERPQLGEHSESIWGQQVQVGKPVGKDDPKFSELQRSLTGGSRRTSHHEDEFDLAKRVKAAKGKLEEQGVQDKRLDVSWKNLSVRGVGAEAMFADDIGRSVLLGHAQDRIEGNES